MSLCHQELRPRSDEAFNLHIYDFNLDLTGWRELLQTAGLAQSWEVKTNTG